MTTLGLVRREFIVGETPADPLWMYDVTIDRVRYVTQDDCGAWQDACNRLALERAKLRVALGPDGVAAALAAPDPLVAAER